MKNPASRVPQPAEYLMLLLLLWASFVPARALALDDHEVEYLAEKADGIAAVKIKLSPAGSTGANTYLFRRWVRRLPPGITLAQDWDRGCLRKRKQLESAVKRCARENLPGIERLRNALRAGEYEVVLFFKGQRSGKAHVWCEGQSVLSGLGWLSHPEHGRWMSRLLSALRERERLEKVQPRQGKAAAHVQFTKSPRKRRTPAGLSGYPLS